MHFGMHTKTKKPRCRTDNGAFHLIDVGHVVADGLSLGVQQSGKRHDVDGSAEFHV